MKTAFSIQQAAEQAQIASRELVALTHQDKQALLLSIADILEQSAIGVLEANQKDIKVAKKLGLSAAMIDRLTLNLERIGQIASSVREVAYQDDPVGQLGEAQTMKSGIRVQKMRIPLGVIAMIYESRPNVTIDAAVLCLKAGNAVILRGGKEALHSNMALGECIQQGLAKHNIDGAVVTVIPDTNRTVMNELMNLNQYVDLIIPRGGEGLIRFVSENSRIPVIQHYKGVCHQYVDDEADMDKALALLENGKTQRTGVCNALETLLVHQHIAPAFLPLVAEMFATHQVRVHGCEKSLEYFPQAQAATEQDWQAEYLAAEIALRVVDNYAQAVEHIQAYSSGHTEVIVTENGDTAARFIREINSSVVMVNASSRFSDGGQLGLGAEIGISTSKLHAYGPMGVQALTTEKFVVTGEGHIRES